MEPERKSQIVAISKRRLSLYSATGLVFVLAVISFVFVNVRNKSAIKTTALTPLQALSQNSGFPMYSPNPLPRGYAIDEYSMSTRDSIVSYNIVKNSSIITINQQKIPTTPPDVLRIEGFKAIEVSNGTAAAGIQAGKPSGILLTNTTLISIGAGIETPLDTVVAILKSMHVID